MPKKSIPVFTPPSTVTIPKTSLYLGLLLLVAGLAGSFYNLFGSSFQDRLLSPKTIALNNVNPKLVDEINQKIVYSTSETGLKPYYSANLDALFQYPAEKYAFSEFLSTSVSFYPKNRLLLSDSGSISLLKVADVSQKDIQAYFINKYKLLYPSTIVVSSEEKSDYYLIKLNYSNQEFKGQVKKYNRLIMAKKFDTQYAYINFLYTDTFDINSAITDFRQILSSLEISPQNIDKNITLEIADAKIKFSINKQVWNVDGQNLLSVFLSTRQSIEKDKDTSTTATIMASQYYKQVDEAYLQDLIAQEIKSAQTPPVTKGYKLISKDKSLTIGGLKFFQYSYQYLSLGEPMYVNKYYGYNPESQYVVEISCSSTSKDSNGFKEFDQVMSTFNFSTLLTTPIPKPSPAKVLGTSTSVTVDKSSLMGLNSVVHIFNRSCVDITVKSDPDLAYSGGKKYNSCVAGFGSGFFVNKDGYIVTNAHVASSNSFDLIFEQLESSLKYEEGFWYDFGKDVATILLNQKNSPSPDSQTTTSPDSGSADSGTPESPPSESPATLDPEQLLSSIISGFVVLQEKGFISLTPQYENYIEGKEPFKINPRTLALINTNVHQKATLIDHNSIDSLTKIAIELQQGKANGIKIPDLALLKIDPPSSGEYFVLSVANPELISTGQNIRAIGFPGAANDSTLFSQDSSSIPTLTKGTISALKPNYNNSFKLIQMDASIAPGNSGGPIVNEDGEVVGVSTYGLNSEGRADFNVGVGAASIKDLLSRNRIDNTQSQVNQLTSTGLNYLARSYYQWAVRDFEAASILNSKVRDNLSPFIKAAQAKVGTSEDKTPLFTLGPLELGQEQLIFTAISVVVLLVGIVIVFAFVKKSKVSQLIATPAPTLPATS